MQSLEALILMRIVPFASVHLIQSDQKPRMVFGVYTSAVPSFKFSRKERLLLLPNEALYHCLLL